MPGSIRSSTTRSARSAALEAGRLASSPPRPRARRREVPAHHLAHGLVVVDDEHLSHRLLPQVAVVGTGCPTSARLVRSGGGPSWSRRDLLRDEDGQPTDAALGDLGHGEACVRSGVLHCVRSSSAQAKVVDRSALRRGRWSRRTRRPVPAAARSTTTRPSGAPVGGLGEQHAGSPPIRCCRQRAVRCPTGPLGAGPGRRLAARRGAALSGSGDRLAREVDAQHLVAPCGQSAASRPGPQPRSTVLASTPLEEELVIT